MRLPGSRMLGVLAVFGFFSLSLCGSASAYVYWSETAPQGTIGRASLLADLEPGQNWIGPAPEGCGIAVDAEHLYWTTRDGHIGRAALDGSRVEPDFILLSGWACGVAVDSGHLYWAYNSSGKLGRAALDGSEVQPNWMSPGAGRGCGIAVQDSTVYWATSTGVYKAALAGGPPTPLTTVTKENCGIAVNAAHAYWATGEGFIERDPLSGGPPTPIVQAPLGPCGVAVDERFLYWGNSQSDSVGRANLDGSGAEPRFIAGADHPCGVAVDRLSGPGPAGGESGSAGGSNSLASNDFRFGQLRKNRSRGIARLELLLPGPGEIFMHGRRVVSRDIVSTAAASPAAPVKLQLLIAPKPGTRRILRAVGKAGASFAVTFSPAGGRPRTRYNRIRLAFDRPRR
jgi:hypothetical protein